MRIRSGPPRVSAIFVLGNALRKPPSALQFRLSGRSDLIPSTLPGVVLGHAERGVAKLLLRLPDVFRLVRLVRASLCSRIHELEIVLRYARALARRGEPLWKRAERYPLAFLIDHPRCAHDLVASLSRADPVNRRLQLARDLHAQLFCCRALPDEKEAVADVALPVDHSRHAGRTCGGPPPSHFFEAAPRAVRRITSKYDPPPINPWAVSALVLAPENLRRFLRKADKRWAGDGYCRLPADIHRHEGNNEALREFIASG